MSAGSPSRTMPTEPQPAGSGPCWARCWPGDSGSALEALLPPFRALDADDGKPKRGTSMAQVGPRREGRTAQHFGRPFVQTAGGLGKMVGRLKLVSLGPLCRPTRPICPDQRGTPALAKWSRKPLPTGPGTPADPGLRAVLPSGGAFPGSPGMFLLIPGPRIRDQESSLARR
jgi:hypothetical protein